MAFLLIFLSAVLYTAGNYWGELYILNWFSLLPLFYYLFKYQAEKKFNYKKYFITGLFFGFFILFFSANFLYHSIKLYTGASFGLIIILLILLFLLLALIYALFFLLYVFLERKINPELKFNPYLFAAFWLLFELTRYYFFGFFPLANPAYTQAEFLHFIQLAEYGGIWILSFILVLFNGLLYQLIFEKKFKNLISLFLIILIIFSAGSWSLNKNYKSLPENENLSLGIITTQIKQQDKWQNQQLEENINILLESASNLNGVGLIIAPETNITFDLNSNQYYRKQLLSKIAAEFNVPVQIGSLASRSSESGRYNSSFLISKNGEILDRYDKNLLLYFGETYPYLELLNKYTPYNFSSLNSGTESNLFKLENLQWKTVICSEILYPDYVKLETEQVDFIVNQTNEAWFNNSRLLKNIMWQAAVLRAVENRTAVIKTGNQAHNGIIYPSGSYQKVDSTENYYRLEIN